MGIFLTIYNVWREKGNIMEFENTKSNQIKTTLALTSTLALLGTGVGMGHTVNADDMTTADQSPKLQGEEATLAPTNIEDTKAAIDIKTATLAEQTDALNTVNETITSTNEELATLEGGLADKETAVADAEKTLESVSNASEEEFNQLAEQNKADLAKTQEELKLAEATKEEVATQVLTQSDEVTAAANEAKKMAEKVAQAETKVSDLTKMVNQPEAITAQVEIEQNNVKIISEDLAKAKTDLVAVTDNTKTQLANDLATAQSSLSAKQNELAKVQSQTSNVAVNVMGANKMVAPTNYPINEIKKLMSSGYIGTQSYLNTFYALKDQLVSKAEVGAYLNHYVDIASDLNRIVNPDNLSVEVQNELAVFAATLINSVRQQFGLSAVEVTQGAQEFARTLTQNYKATHGNTVPFFNYNQPGKNGHIGIGPHDRTIIEQAATSVGLKANDDNMYENIGFFDDVHTVNGIKRSIYNSIKYMLFTDFTYGNTFGHTVNLLRSDKTNPSAPVYLGVSTETVGGLNTHYVIFPASNIVNASQFSKQVVSGPLTTVDNSAKISTLQASIASVESKIQTLQKRIANISSEALVISAQRKVDGLAAKLQKAESNVEKAKAQLQQLQDSKEDLHKQLAFARSTRKNLKGQLDESLVHLNQSKILLHSLEEKQNQVASQINVLTLKKAQLEKELAFNSHPNREKVAKEKVEEAQKALTETLSEIKTKKAILNDLTQEKAKLTSAITTTEQQIVLLKNHLANQVANAPKISNIVQRSENNRVRPDVSDTREEVVDTAQEATILAQAETVAKEVITNSAKAIIANAQNVAQEIMKVAPEVTPDQGVVAKVADNIKKNNAPASKSYGASSSTVGNATSSRDESTKRALRAGIVMLAAAGLTGYKLRRDGKK